MPGPTDSARRLIEFSVHVSHLGDCLSFHDLCCVLRLGGITLQSVASAVKRKPHDFALEANNVIWTFRELYLDRDITTWLWHWDAVAYEYRLSTADQAFLIARQQWILLSDSGKDVPRKRWPELLEITERIGADASKTMIRCAFGETTTPEAARVVDEACAQCGLTREALLQILGPCDPGSREYAGEAKRRGCRELMQRQRGHRGKGGSR